MGRKPVIVLASSPGKTRVVTLGTKKLHLPNSLVDWQIGKRQGLPQSVALQLLYNSFLGIVDKATIRKYMKESTRILLPSGSYCYIVSHFNDSLLSSCKRVRKFFSVSDSIQLSRISSIKHSSAFETYDGFSIEAIQTIFGNG